MNSKHKHDMTEESQHFKTEKDEESLITEYEDAKHLGSKKQVSKISPEKSEDIFNKKSLKFHLQRHKNHSGSFRTEK